MKRSESRGFRILVVVSLALLALFGGSASGWAADAGALKDDMLKAEADRKKAEEEAAAKAAKEKKKKPEKPKDGWHPSLKAGFNFAFSQNQGVVGIPDGVTLALGLQLQGDLIFRKGTHEWVSKLSILHTQTKIPNIEPFIKAADLFELGSLYQYRFPKLSWLGVFAGLRVQTALLPGSVVRDTDIAATVKELDGTLVNRSITAQDPFRLTGPFAPLFFKQFAGALAKALERPWMNIDVRLGLGAVEAWTRDGLAVADDAATADVLEINRLQDYSQLGGELQLSVGGVLANKLLTYGLGAEVMYPFVHNAETDLEGTELINVDFRFTLGIKLWSWASLVYSLNVLRVPLIVDKWQVTNNLMLSITANLVK